MEGVLAYRAKSAVRRGERMSVGESLGEGGGGGCSHYGIQCSISKCSSDQG